MSIEKSIRSLVGREKGHQGYYIPETSEFVYGDILLATDDVYQVDVIDEVGGFSVVLTCHIEAHQMISDTTVTRIENGKTLEAFKLYPNSNSHTDTAYSSVDIMYNGLGYILYNDGRKEDFVNLQSEHYELKLETNKIYTHDFICKAQPEIVERVNIPDASGVVNIHSYGGHYLADEDISLIDQTFFQVINWKGKTAVRVSDKRFWRSNGIDPIAGGNHQKSTFLQVDRDRYDNDISRMNLGEIVQSGQIKFCILGRNSGAIHDLKSVNFRQIQDGGKMEIIFEIQ